MNPGRRLLLAALPWAWVPALWASEPGQPAPQARLRGEGELRVWGLAVYRARLWTEPEFDPQDYAAHPFWLELTYARAFAADAIARRSLEEMRRQGPIPPALAQAWEAALRGVLPDVRAGDRLLGGYRPGEGAWFTHGERPLGRVADPEFARRFFGIWLSDSTSAPALRTALLGPQAAARGS